jgi:hypothetical protein
MSVAKPDIGTIANATIVEIRCLLSLEMFFIIPL